MEKTLKDIGRKYGTDKFEHGFLDFYDEILSGKDITSVLEIGVYNGASIRMWRDYFPGALIVGVDINPAIDINGAIIVRADATTKEFADTLGGIDLIIDDGSHKSSDQIKSFELLWEKLHPGGIYILEDTHTSFMSAYMDTPVSAYVYFKEFSEKNCDTPCKEFWKNGLRDDGTLVLFKNK